MTIKKVSSMNVSRRWMRQRLLVLLALIALPFALVLYVDLTTRGRRFTDPGQVPPRPVAIVFGAEVRPNGQLSPMLAARVRQAVALYRLGRVQKILMTGDNSRKDYDEVTAMKRAAIALGAPAEIIHLDYAGFSTYESCYRARTIFGVRQAVLITQGFHLPRAVYTCTQLGIDAVGLETDDRGRYSRYTMRRHVTREVLATAKAMWDVHLWRPLPTFLGNYEGMD